MAGPRTAGGRAARVAAAAALALLGLVVAAALAALVVLRTDAGRARLLALALPRIQPALAGRLTVASIEGDLIHTLIVHDAAITAADGRPAISAHRLEAHFSLLRLLRGDLRLDDVRGQGVWFGMHLMPDGRFNLAGLTAEAPPTVPGGPRAHFLIAHADLDAVLRYDAPTMPVSLRLVEAAVHVEGGLEIDGDTVRVPLAHVDGLLLPPLLAPVRAHGRLLVADGALTLDDVAAALELDAAAVRRLLPDELLGSLAPLRDRLGPAHLELSAGGGVTPLALQAQASFAGPRASASGVVMLAAAGPSWTATAAVPGADLSSTGGLDWDFLGPLQGSIKARDLSGLAALGLPAIAGRGRASATLVRGAAASDLTVDLEGSSLRVAGVAIERLAGRGSTRGRTGAVHGSARGLRLGPLALDTLELDGRDDGGQSRLDLRAQGPRSSRITLAVRGAPVVAPERSANAAFDHALVEGTLQASGQTLSTRRSARVSLGRTVRIDGLALALLGGELDGSGSWDTGHGGRGRLRAAVTARALDLRQLLAVVAPGVAVPDGALEIDLQAGGTARAPTADAVVRLAAAPPPAGVDAAARQSGAAQLTAHLGGGALKGTLSASLGGQHLSAEFRLPRLPAAGRPATGHATFDVDLAPSAALPPALPLASGRIHGELDLGGAWPAPRLRLRAASPGGALAVHAELPLSASAPWHLDARLRGFSLDLAALPISGLAALAATVDAQVEVGGTRAAPSWSGFVRAHDVALRLRGGALAYEHGVVDLSLEQQQVTLRRLAFGIGTGTFEGSGSARLDGLRLVGGDGVVRLAKYPLSLRGVNGWLTAALTLHIERGDGGLGGRVVVDSGLVQLADLSRVRSVQSTATPAGVRYVDQAGLRDEAERAAAEKSAEEAAAGRGRAAAGGAGHGGADLGPLTITLPGGFRVEGQEVRTTVEGKLSIAGLPAAALITGQIAAPGGSVDLLGRRYLIERLTVGFDGAPTPDPELDVRISRTTDVKVVIEVQGPASDPEVIFSSVPPVYSREQVMAMILSGSPSETTVGAESLDSRVASALSGTFVGQLKDQLLPILPVDVIKVDAAKSSLGQQDTRFEAGKYLTESIYLSYVHQLGTVLGLRRLNRNQAQLEYRFARHFELQSSFGDNGVGAIDLYWNHHF